MLAVSFFCNEGNKAMKEQKKGKNGNDHFLGNIALILYFPYVEIP